MSSVLDSRIKVVVDEFRRRGEDLTEKAVAGWVDETFSLSKGDARELVEAVGEYAKSPDYATNGKAERPLPPVRDVLSSRDMVKLGAEYFRRYPNATGRQAYDYLQTVGKPAIKRSSWECAQYAGTARDLAKKDGPKVSADVPQEQATTAPTMATARRAPATPEPAPPPLEASEPHPKIKIPRGDIEQMEPVKCAVPECGTVFMIDARDKKDLMETGEILYCPQGCPNTYDKDGGQAEAPEDEPDPEHVLTMVFDQTYLSAHPKKGDFWQVKFDGEIKSWVLNEIITDLYDRVLRAQGVDTDEVGSMYGTRSASAEYELRKIREEIQALNRAPA